MFQITPHLYTAARPRSGDWLTAELRAWQAGGITHVVSLLTPAESMTLDLVDEGRLASQLGLAFSTVPIVDRQPPSSSLAFHTALAPARACLAEGGCVLAHCRQGIGRASLTAAALLVDAGWSPADAWQRIAQARGRPVPDTDEQRRWLTQYAAWCALRS